MESAEYTNLAEVERQHWYYSGKRTLVAHWVERLHPLRPDDVLLDFGAGTGIFAREMAERCRVLVHDPAPEARVFLEQYFSQDTIVSQTSTGLDLPDASVDVVTALDVLEHLDDDAGVVGEFHRLLRPGGLLVVTVPADPRLWSDWDVSLQHRRRYQKTTLRALFPAGSWDILDMRHTNLFAYPVVYWLRVARRSAPGRPRAEDRLPSAWLNTLLRWLLVIPAIATWFPAPFGVSLLLVARRR